MTDMIDTWVVAMRARALSSRTIEERVRTIGALARHHDADPLTLGHEQLSAWLAHGGRSAATLCTYHSDLHAFYAWAVTTGRRADNPMTLVGKPRRPRGVPHPVADEHLAALLAADLRPPTRAMILLAALAGLRVHEIAKLRGEDVDAVAGTLTVIGKGGHRAVLPLHDDLAELAETMPRTGWWFPSNSTRSGEHVHSRTVSDTIKGAMRRASVPGSAHSLRHWFGTTLVDEGADLRTAQTLLRHASLATTQIYVASNPRQQTAAIERLDVNRTDAGGDRSAVEAGRDAASEGAPKHKAAAPQSDVVVHLDADPTPVWCAYPYHRGRRRAVRSITVWRPASLCCGTEIARPADVVCTRLSDRDPRGRLVLRGVRDTPRHPRVARPHRTGVGMTEHDRVPTRAELRRQRAWLLAIDVAEVMPASGKAFGDSTPADLRALGHPAGTRLADDMERWGLRGSTLNRYIAVRVAILDDLIGDGYVERAS